MKKRTCLLVGFHAIVLAGIATGYCCTLKKCKKNKKNNFFE